MISKIISIFDKKDDSDNKQDEPSEVKVPFSLEMAQRRYEEELRSEFHIAKHKSMQYSEFVADDDFLRNIRF